MYKWNLVCAKKGNENSSEAEGGEMKMPKSSDTSSGWQWAKRELGGAGHLLIENCLNSIN